MEAGRDKIAEGEGIYLQGTKHHSKDGNLEGMLVWLGENKANEYHKEYGL